MSDYLEHHGILGQKWGVRRYQNADGTLTAAGKKRLAKTFYKPYNKATNIINTKFPEINARYQGKDLGEYFETKWGQKYIKEINETWQNLYSSELKKQYSKSITIGEDWVKEAPLMDMYVDYIKHD